MFASTKNERVFIYLILILIIGAGIFGVVNFKTQKVDNTQTAVLKAQAVYSELKNKGVDFSNGPCISENLMPDWVADTAHNPRQSVDNLPENQCQSFREGRAHHFVELDPNGNFIQAM